jgi:hypothetical protein
MVLPPGENIRKFTVVVSQVGLIYFPHTKYILLFKGDLSPVTHSDLSVSDKKRNRLPRVPPSPPANCQTELRNL